MADFKFLQHYLTAGIPVQHAAHGVGTLVGLPYCTSHEKPRAEVRFPDEEMFQYYDLEHVTPVLYDAADWLFRSGIPDRLMIPIPVLRVLRNYGPLHLDAFAQTIDFLRANGVAIGIEPREFIRKEVDSG